MHEDRLRWLVRENKHLTIDGAVEIAKAAPAILKLIEDQSRLLTDVRVSGNPHAHGSTEFVAFEQGRSPAFL